MDFSHVLNLSITASWLILAVLLLRLLLRKAPRWITVALWGLVALRLLMPFSIESSFSLIPSSETVPEELLRYQGVQLQEPARLDVVDNPALYHNEVSIELEQSVDRVQWSMVKLTFPWLIGVGLMLLYAAVSYIRLRRQVRTAVRLRENIYQSENVPSPFVLGVIRPRIYLPFTMEEQSLPHVIAHEQAHIRRRDHWWKPLGFLLLSIHWFNPLMWLAYWLLCRDIELACDEKVIKELGTEDRADYSEALLRCSAGQRRISACPLAFGESDVKKRVKSVLSYKKPAFWVIAAAVLASIVVAVCFLTNPESSGKNPNAYYLRIGTEGVMSVEVSVPHGSGGAVHADGSPFTVGEEVWLERLDGMDDLRGVSITALGENGEVLYALSIPEGASDEEIVNIVSGDGWLLAPSTSSESASIGIIGGADGPTAIFVTGGHHFGVTFERDGGITGINLPNLAFHPLPDDNPTYAHNLSAGNLADLPLIPYTFPNNGDVTISYTVYSSANAPENILMTDTAIGPDGSFLHVDEAGQPIGQEAKFTREKIWGAERFTCLLEPSQFNLAYSSTGPHETFRCFSLRYQIDGQWMEACFVLRTAEEYVNAAAGMDVAVEPIEQFRTDYIGDASKVSAIAQRLPYPDGYSYASIALQTDAPPYGLTVFLKGRGEIDEAAFPACADLAFDLIGNMGQISFCGENGDVMAAFSRPEYIEKGSGVITPETVAARYIEMERLFENAAPWRKGSRRVTGDWDGDGIEDSAGFGSRSHSEFTVELSGSGTLSIRTRDTAWTRADMISEDAPWGVDYYFDVGDLNSDGIEELVFALDTGTQGGDGAYCLLVCPTDGMGIEAFTQIETGQSYRIYWEKETDTLRLECKETGYVERITERALIDPYLDTGEVKAQRIAWLESLGEDVPAGYADGVSGFVITDDGHIITSQYVTAPGGSHSEMFGNMLTEYAYGQDGQLQVLRAWFVHRPQE